MANNTIERVGRLIIAMFFLFWGASYVYAEDDVRPKLYIKAINALTKRPFDSTTFEVFNKTDSTSFFGFSENFAADNYVWCYLPRNPSGKFVVMVGGLDEKYKDDGSAYYERAHSFEAKKIEFDASVFDESDTYKLDVVLNRKKIEKQLDEFEFTASKVMFYYEGDTLVYNADAFVLAEGSMLDDLFAQMPGVTMDKDGRIKVRDRYVDCLMVNGKDLCVNNSVMFENLPAYTIKDIAFYDKLGRTSELMGERVSGDVSYVMDVRLKREYSYGWFMNAEGGYGSENRYLGRLFGLMFSENFSLSAYASANNLTDSSKPGRSDGVWSRDNVNSGVQSRESGGIAYNVHGPAARWELKGNVDVVNNRTEEVTSSTVQRFFDDGDYYSFSKASDSSRSLDVSTSHNLFFKLSDRINLTVDPSFSYKKQSSGYMRDLSQMIDDKTNAISLIKKAYFGDSDSLRLITRTLQNSSKKSSAIEGKILASADIKLKQTGMKNMLTVDLEANVDNESSDRFKTYETELHKYRQEDYRYHIKGTPNLDQQYAGKVTFRQFFNWRNVSLPISYRVSYRDRHQNETGWYLVEDSEQDGVTSAFIPEYAPELGFKSRLLETRHEFNISFNQGNMPFSRSSRWSFKYDLSGNFYIMHRDYTFNGQSLLSNEYLYSVKGFLFCYIPGRFNFNIYVRSSSSAPDVRTLVDIPTADPLTVKLGNRALKKSIYNYYQVNATFDHKRWTHLLNMWASTKHRGVTNSFWFDPETGISTYKYINGKDEFKMNLKYDCMTRFGYLQRFSILSKTELGYSHTMRGVASMDMSDNSSIIMMDDKRLGESIEIGWRNGSMTFNANGGIKIDRYEWPSGYAAPNTTLTGNVGMSAIVNLPKNWSISTDLSLYTRRGYLMAELNTSDLIWNMQVTKSICKGRVVLALDGYDLLQQISNIAYSVDATMRSETITNSIPSFVLFHVQYHFSRNPKR